MRLNGKVSIVTGGAMGIGEGIAVRLAMEGATVVVADIVIEQAERVVDAIKAMGVKAIAIRTDVSKTEEVNWMVETVLKAFEKIDILVNNAGGSARERGLPFCDSTETIWRSVIDRNLFGMLNCSRAVINHMIERRSGKIVNMSSAAASGYAPGNLEYAAAKAAIVAATKVLAREVGDFGINVNVIAPGAIDTLGLRAVKGADGLTAFDHLSRLEKFGALPVVGQPADVGNLVAFLVSDEARLISGQYYEMGCLGRIL